MFYQYIDGAGYTYVHKPEPLASAVDSDFAAGEIPY
jgi:hypothetical protein